MFIECLVRPMAHENSKNIGIFYSQSVFVYQPHEFLLNISYICDMIDNKLLSFACVGGISQMLLSLMEHDFRN